MRRRTTSSRSHDFARLRVSRPVCAAGLIILLLIGALASTGPAMLFNDQLSAQVTPLDDEVDDAPGLGSITGTPEPGPKPEDAGDRGGVAQLGFAIVLLSGLAFMVSRVAKGARSSG